jgi:hypothetical protein
MKNHIAFAQFCSVRLGNLLFSICLGFCTLGLGVSASAQQLSITTFNVPAAGTDAYQGTIPSSLNNLGGITGYYVDSNNVYHGFVGTPGAFTDFDTPGAGGYGTFPIGINDEGATVGYYTNSNFNFLGFLRRPDGTFETRRGPNACTTSTAEGCYGTGFFAINISGLIAGDYEDENFAQHGLLMERDGRVIGYEAPGAFLAAYQGTNYNGIGPGLNNLGAVTSLYNDKNGVYHGYLRSPDGTFTDFDAPGAGAGTGQGTTPLSLNDFGVIAGYYLDKNNVYHGFLRNPDGTFRTFEAPGADTTKGSFNGTFPSAINVVGAITGNYIDANNVSHGFVRTSDGTFTTFDAPGAGKHPGHGTYPASLNDFGEIIGGYLAANNVYHGFVAIPAQCCEGDDKETTEPSVESTTSANQADPGLPSALSPLLRRIMPWYRSAGMQPSK